MALNAPSFWARGQEQSLRARMLAPLGWLYHHIVQRRLQATPETAPVPVICVGNATVGGVGKTPFVRMLGEALKRRGQNVFVLTRGYGGSEKGPHLVAESDDAARVGDEPKMLSASLPVIVSADRPAGAQLAAELGANVILMDDGFQNPSLEKTLSIMLVDAQSVFGNGHVFPAGPLREKAVSAASRADAFVSVGETADTNIPVELRDVSADQPMFRAWFEIDKSSIPNGPISAFCGIGRPERFQRSLEESGSTILFFKSFPDHHPFSEQEIVELKEEAKRLGSTLVTTEKDGARFAAEQRDGITLIRGVMRTSDEVALLRMIEATL